jgi:uncharacterized phiE125 gp8 family phage protein
MHYASSIALITGPTDSVLTLADCKTALGITDTSQDDMITALIDAVVGSLDPATGGYLGRALRPQTWEYRLDSFPGREIEIPYPPLISITSVKYDDFSGTEQTLTEGTDFNVIALDDFDNARIAVPYASIWPVPRRYPESVRIRFQSGYATTPADSLPKAIKSAIALCVRSLLNNAEQNLYLSQRSIQGVGSRSYVVSAAANAAIQQATDTLLASYRVYW